MPLSADQFWGDFCLLFWQVGGQVSRELKNLLLVLIMTLPGSPTVQYDEEIRYTQVKSELETCS